MDNHISKEQFLLEFFGNFGREFGDPDQHFTDSPNEIFQFIKECFENKKPAFISVQPRNRHNEISGFEKIFWDFDYGKKSDKFSSEQIAKKKQELEQEIRIFIHHITLHGYVPLIVKTRKGYHVYLYFDKIYQIDNNEEYWKKVYRELQETFTKNNRHEYEFIDSSIIGDIMRMGRIPTSIHEKNGAECIILDANFKPDKFRSLEYYKQYGLREHDLKAAIERVNANIEAHEKYLEATQKEHKENWEIKHGFIGKIRQCFQIRMDAGEMPHQQRLALLIEAYWAGYDTREKMVELFRCFHDFDGDKDRSVCHDQVDWFFKNKIDEIKCKCMTKPYRCKTIESKGWCLKESCQIYVKRRNLKNA